MTELHTNNIFRQQQQLPPIMSTTATTSTPNNTNGESFHNNNSMMEEDTNRRSLSHPYPTTANASSSSQWMNNNNTNNHASTGYSPRDSCDMSYDGEDYHHNHGQPTPSPSASTERSRSKKHRTPSTRDIHVEKNTEGKPPYSYATLIKYAIENSLRKKLTLAEIYQWVIEHYPYYGSAGTGWKNSIRHNLSLNKSFVRVPRPINEPGKGSYWQVDYRAAEAELRSKTTMAVRGRANRSGSDPYRPDSSWAALNAAQPSSNNTRFTRDSRSLSMDSNMNTSTKQPNTPTSTGFPTSSSSSSSGIGGYSSNGYYGNSGYGYNAQTPQQQQQTRHHMNRHSADYSRSPYMYDMYANQPPPTAAPVDVQQHGYQQHQQQQQHHHHHNHNHHNAAAAAAAVHNRMPNNMYDGGQPPYGHPMYPSYTYGGPVMTTENKEPPSQPEEQQGSFSTPQPHYRRVNSPKAEPYHSPSPPQPTDTKRVKSKPSVAVNGGNNHEYDWIA